MVGLKTGDVPDVATVDPEAAGGNTPNADAGGVPQLEAAVAKSGDFLGAESAPEAGDVAVGPKGDPAIAAPAVGDGNGGNGNGTTNGGSGGSGNGAKSSFFLIDDSFSFGRCAFAFNGVVNAVAACE